MDDSFEFELESFLGLKIVGFLSSDTSPLLRTRQSNGCRSRCRPASQLAARQRRLAYYDEMVVEMEQNVDSSTVTVYVPSACQRSLNRCLNLIESVETKTRST